VQNLFGMIKQTAKAAAVAAALWFVAGLPAFAQVGQGTQVYWNGSRQDVAANVATSVTTAATLTLTPQSGQYVYLTAVRIQNCAGASAVSAAAPTSVTTTNLNGATWQVGSGTTAGACAQDIVDAFGGAPLKAAAAGTAVTIVLPTFATNQTVRVSAYWYSAN
jgi:hypothetical protein